MIINDGYNRTLTFGEHCARFRPMLAWERSCFKKRMRVCGDVNQVVAACMDRIEYSTFDAAWMRETWDSNYSLFVKVWKNLLGVGNAAEEQADAENLRSGLTLIRKYPHAKRGVCDFCKKHWFDPERGCLTAEATMERSGDVPCDIPGLSCPIGHWSNPNVLSQKNEAAFRFHMECKATGIFPCDSIVRQNARIIEEVLGCATSAKSSKR